MNVLIFEDERHTANRLSSLLTECNNSINILAIIGSVKEGISWLNNNEIPDLIFQDIILSDGNCFDIFDAVNLTSPIIFTTAFSEYALRSFEVNSIDYIVKPYDISDIRKALDKFNKFKGAFQPPDKELLEEIINNSVITPKKRFLIKSGDNYNTIVSSDIAYLASDEGITTATLFNKQKHIVDYSIVDLSKLMDSHSFFNTNRKIIINIESVVKINSWFNSRLKIEVVPHFDEDIIVSRERVKNFKEWLNK
ncbi:MAG: LytTR family DNA-binding domain-containing protein [Bacteroidota bacterium]